MFNETSYPSGLFGLSDAARVQARLDAGKKVKQAKIIKFGLTAPVTTMPLPRRPIVQEGGGGAGVLVDPLMPAAPTSDAGAAAGDSGGADSGGGSGFDLGGIFSAIPWWGWAIGAYFLLKKR
jgi:hypothetical protein